MFDQAKAKGRSRLRPIMRDPTFLDRWMARWGRTAILIAVVVATLVRAWQMWENLGQ